MLVKNFNPNRLLTRNTELGDGSISERTVLLKSKNDVEL